MSETVQVIEARMEDILPSHQASPQALAAVEKEITGALLEEHVTGVISQDTQKSGAQLLIDQSINVIDRTHDETIRRVDEMIVTLQALKVQIVSRRDKAKAEVRDFISTMGEALSHVDHLKETIETVQSDHL